MKITLNYLAFLLFFGLYLVLPEYFALEVSGSLPLLTGSRAVLLFILLVYLISCRGRISLKLCCNRKVSRGLYAYFIGMIIIDVINIRYSMSSLNAIITVVFEEWLVVWIITRVVTSKKKFVASIKILVFSSGLVAVISIISTLIGYNLFYSINTVHRSMLQASYLRMGLIRAEAGFGHPVYYGMYCVLMMILSLYLYENEQMNRVFPLACILLNIFALVLANSRGSLFVCAVVLIILFFTSHQIMVKKYLFWICTGGIALLIVCVASNTVRSYVGDLVASLASVVNKNIIVSNYGGNISGTSSRIAQFSSIYYVLQRNPFFGLGAKCHDNGLLKWFWDGKWRELTTLDVGIVATIVQYGLSGLIMQINLFVQWLRIPLSCKKYDSTYRYLCLLSFAYLLGLLTISNLHDTMWVLLSLTISYINIDYRNSQISDDVIMTNQ